MIFSHVIPKGYKIRLAKENDVPLLDAIEEAAGTIFPPGLLPENILAERVSRDAFLDAIQKDRLFVIVDSEQIPVGFAFWQEVAGYALLALIEVDPQHGRQGLGTALVSQIISQVGQAGHQHLYLTTLSNISWNAPFYQKVGFVILNAEQLPEFINNILLNEQRRGLNNRVAMRHSIIHVSKSYFCGV